MLLGPDARADFEQRLYRRSDGSADGERVPALPAPEDVSADGAAGHIRLQWKPVAGAAGYVVGRAVAGYPEEILRHGGSDVPAMPVTAFADTGVADGVTYQYRVGAVAGAEHPVEQWSAEVVAQPSQVAPEPVEVRVDAAHVTGPLNRIWRMIGTERLSQLLLDGDQRDIAVEFAEALRLVHDDLGVTHVRAHAILHDDNRVVRRDEAGALRCDFDRVDAIYDRLLSMGLRPIVELSFMPAAIARDPEQTVFTYRGIISPPADWAEWRYLVNALAAHLVDRYGLDEVAQWAFEVWNEPNLEVFWTGTRDEYLRLYDESARAVKAVDERLRIGGPSTAASEWVGALAAHAWRNRVPLDFVTTHTYGNMPLDLRPALADNGGYLVPIWWTEWGVGSTHFGPIHDRAFGAPFVLSGYASAQDHLDALAYWVASDHFEELGRPPCLFHNGFGLLTVGNLAKPRYWAAHLAAHQGDHVLDTAVTGDGADVLVHAWATRHDGADATPDGTVDVLLWNGTINAALLGGDPRLDRLVRIAIDGLDADGYHVSVARVDERHSNINAHCPPDVVWPDDSQWAALRAHNRLSVTDLPDTVPDHGTASFALELPMPGVIRLRLTPAPSANRTGGSAPTNEENR